jgi:hypothetical protein
MNRHKTLSTVPDRKFLLSDTEEFALITAIFQVFNYLHSIVIKCKLRISSGTQLKKENYIPKMEKKSYHSKSCMFPRDLQILIIQ